MGGTFSNYYQPSVDKSCIDASILLAQTYARSLAGDETIDLSCFQRVNDPSKDVVSATDLKRCVALSQNEHVMAALGYYLYVGDFHHLHNELCKNLCNRFDSKTVESVRLQNLLKLCESKLGYANRKWQTAEANVTGEIVDTSAKTSNVEERLSVRFALAPKIIVDDEKNGTIDDVAGKGITEVEKYRITNAFLKIQLEELKSKYGKNEKELNEMNEELSNTLDVLNTEYITSIKLENCIDKLEDELEQYKAKNAKLSAKNKNVNEDMEALTSMVNDLRVENTEIRKQKRYR